MAVWHASNHSRFNIFKIFVCIRGTSAYVHMFTQDFFVVLSPSALSPSKLEWQVLRARFLGSISILPAVRCGIEPGTAG